MIIGLLGPSCSGKSFFLKSLRELGNFFIPMSITTRPQREEELWHLKHVSRRAFEKMKEKGKLCFVAEAFHGSYACLKFRQASDLDTALIITRGNIPELKSMGGIVVKIIPSDSQKAIKKINLQNRGNKEKRIEALLLDLSTKEDALANVIFENRYDEESFRNFLNLIQNLKQNNT
jgi:guanylate kinase